ncbi:MAG: hypothetical protein JXA54_15410 [Candidatus Heimdallarchaeota archaeon]|nr:hypothetical protein [Candidatus Heimdallarchaeota archaeon]
MPSRTFVNEINEMKNDSVSSAVTLTSKLLRAIRTEISDTDDLNKDLPWMVVAVKLVHPEMAAMGKISEALNFELKEGHFNKEKIEFMLNDLEKSINESEKLTVEELSSELLNYNRIMTISYSSTVFKALIEIPVKEREIIVLESRPLLEGQKFAEDLAKEKYQVKLIADAAAGYYSSNIEAIVVGADTIFPEYSIINKIGTLSLALIAQQNDIPFIVGASKNKITIISEDDFSKLIEEKPENEIYTSYNEKLKVGNVYFDFIPAALITKLISE